MKAKNFLPIAVLVSICIVAALLLSLVNMITAPIIEAAQNASANEALLVVLPDGKNFEKLTIDATYPSVVQEGYRADGGFVFRMSVSGKSSGLVVMCGIDSEGKIVGTKVIANQETPEYAAKVFPNVEGLEGAYAGMDIGSFQPYLVSKATLTSEAYGEAIKAALQAFAIANGGSVDLRTPEQILQDNCNAALGTSGVTFKKWFATEVLEGIDAVYEAADNSGRVYVIGESFAGVKADGTIVDLGGADEAVIKAADEAVKASVLTEVTTLPEGIKKTVTKISVTASGNYGFEVLGHGYYYESNYEFAGIEEGEIEIKLSISADGKIIDVITVYQEETEGLGDVCATEDYYEQYRGHSNEDIVITVPNPDFYQTQTPEGCTDIGVIAGATFTSTAYQSAVKAAFAAYELLIAGGTTNG